LHNVRITTLTFTALGGQREVVVTMNGSADGPIAVGDLLKPGLHRAGVAKNAFVDGFGVAYLATLLEPSVFVTTEQHKNPEVTCIQVPPGLSYTGACKTDLRSRTATTGTLRDELAGV